jgi:hypothetical protein
MEWTDGFRLGDNFWAGEPTACSLQNKRVSLFCFEKQNKKDYFKFKILFWQTFRSLVFFYPARFRYTSGAKAVCRLPGNCGAFLFDLSSLAYPTNLPL